MSEILILNHKSIFFYFKVGVYMCPKTRLPGDWTQSCREVGSYGPSKTQFCQGSACIHPRTQVFRLSLDLRSAVLSRHISFSNQPGRQSVCFDQKPKHQFPSREAFFGNIRRTLLQGLAQFCLLFLLTFREDPTRRSSQQMGSR